MCLENKQSKFIGVQLLKRERERERERILYSFRKFLAITLIGIIYPRIFPLFSECVSVTHSLCPDPEP